jgi:hypothetical protein
MAHLLERWLTLTQDEAVAIQDAAWMRVTEIQAGKAALQQLIIDVHERWEKENPRDLIHPETHPFRAQLGRLISLESRNAELVAVQRRRALVQQQVVEQAGRNLRKVRSSYTPDSPRAMLQSYS